MCWLLIRARSNPKPTGYKAGDIVEIRPDDCSWGSGECLPVFYRVQITDMPFSEKLQDLVQELDRTQTGVNEDGFPIWNLHRIRKHKIDVASIPTQIKNTLRDTGIVKVTKIQIRNYLKNNTGVVVDIDG